MTGFFPIGGAPTGAGPDFITSVEFVQVGGEGGGSIVDISPYMAIFEDQSEPLIHAIEIGGYTLPAGPEITLRRADRDFITRPDDTPAGASFLGEAVEPLAFERSIVRGGMGGYFEGTGEIRLVNEGNAYDGMDEDGELTLRGRPVEVRIGRESDGWAGMAPVLKGTVFDYHVDSRELRLQVRDQSGRLDVPVGIHTYAGTGGFEGTADLAGKRQPIILGAALNTRPTLVWAQKNIYQVDSYPFFTALLDVYMNGATVPLWSIYANPTALANATIPAGYFGWTIGSFFQLYLRFGSVPPTQVPTVDFSANRSLPPFQVAGNSKADLIYALCTTSAGYEVGDFDVPSLIAHSAAHPHRVGIQLDHNTDLTVREAVDRLCGENTFCGHRRNGQLRIGLVDAATSAAVLHLDDTNIIALEKERLPDTVSPPPWQWRVGYAKNWTDMTGRVAGGVSDDRRAFLEEPIRWATAQDAAIKTVWPHAQSRDSEDDMYELRTAATAEAARLLNLWRQGYRLHVVKTGRIGLAAEIGETITVQSDQGGIADTRPMMVVADPLRLSDGTVELIGFGKRVD